MSAAITRAIVFSAFALLCLSRPANAYSVLAHEAMVDALWMSTITPLLRERFPSITREQITAARRYAYGGSVIQDLGYYPFGSKLFTNLVHYVRSGDFVEALLRNARDPDEYAFALGALLTALAQSPTDARLSVGNTDLDAGEPAARAYNPLVEETYAELVDTLWKKHFAGVPPALSADLARHYNTPVTGRRLTRKDVKREAKARRQLRDRIGA